MSFDVGDPVPLSVSVYNEAGVLADATSVALSVTLPDGSVSGPVTVSSSPVGVYAYVFSPSAPGLHVVRWVATGTNATAFTDSFYVRPASVNVGIVSVTDARGYLRVTNPADDEELRRLILVASEVCEERTQAWRRRSVSRTFSGGARDSLYVGRPLASVSSVVEDGVTLAAADYTVATDAGAVFRGSSSTPQRWSPGVQNITVTGVVGPADGVIPDPIQHSVLELVRHLWAYQRGGSGLPRQAGGGAGFPDPGAGLTVPPHVLAVWEPYLPVMVG